MTPPLRIAVLLSGGGLTLQNLQNQIVAGKLHAQIVFVGANKHDAYGLERAKGMNVPTFAITKKEAGSLEEFSKCLFDRCREAKADLVILGGFLTLILVPDDFAGRVMNIHPALIPAFCGKGFYGQYVHEAVLAAGVKVTGCTVHFADNVYDHGPIILQRAVPVYENDTPQTLSSRVFAEECDAYPEAIRLFAEGRLKIEGKRVHVLPSEAKVM
jgi:formyltetrahydrofolate-dependent phosphoribosylglycinamide formyltransferase